MANSSTIFLVSSVGDTDLAIETINKLLETDSTNPIIIVSMTSPAEKRVEPLVKNFPQINHKPLREIIGEEAATKKIITDESAEVVKKFVDKENVGRAYIGVPSPLDEEAALQLASKLEIPVVLAYEYMFRAPKEHSFWTYLPQLPKSCHVAVPLPKAAEEIEKLKPAQETTVVGHLSIDRAFASKQTIDVKAIQEKLLIPENDHFAFISGTTQPTPVDCEFLKALLAELGTGKYEKLQVRFGIHPGVQSPDAYLEALLNVCKDYESLSKQFKIVLTTSFHDKLSKPFQSDFILRADVSGSDACQIADRVAQAVPGALLNESALQGKPVYFHDRSAQSYLGAGFFSGSTTEFFRAIPRPPSTYQVLGLAEECNTAERMVQLLKGVRVSG